MAAVLAEPARSGAAALEAALALEIDPLDYCIYRLGLAEALVMARAAQWAGLAFSAAPPRLRPNRTAIDHMDALAEIRTVRAEWRGVDTVFAAPRFFDFLKLRDHVAAHPHFATRFCVVPASRLRPALVASVERQLLDAARRRLARRWPLANCKEGISRPARLLFAAAMLALVLAVAVGPLVYKPLFVPLAALLLLVPALLRLVAALRAPPVRDALPRLEDAELPVYTVLLPLCEEARMVPQLYGALARMDYPPEKLDIKFVVEQRSAATIAAVRALPPDPRFELVVVPQAPPLTKPKAMNYALPLVRGACLAIYDAEDIPDPQQLRLAAGTFALNPEIHCLQAELVIDNAAETWLSGLFAGEYAGQFGLLLPLLAELRLPVPLGGTSNHFRVETLRGLGGWDPFNVTEDADLGLRLARLGRRTATIASATSEEAPITLRAWMRQRTRWMKGWMQTFIVHNRRPLALWRDLGPGNFIAFQIYILSMVLSALLHTMFLGATMAALLFPRALPQLDLWDGLSIAILLGGYAGATAMALAGMLRLGRPELALPQLLLPLYWVLHSIAALLALHELLTRPYFWAKTRHGRTGMARAPAAAQAE